jgi:alkanesulfonate monooxygenase SsuD/methylene tetrahydromethanopterin reductase-like flavin-dependent oxidoreductase (luciferase family)
MHLGIFSYNVEYGARPDELARACEERDFESFWVGEHTHIPASRQTPYPGGDPLPSAVPIKVFGHVVYSSVCKHLYL